jgi:AcrR family transcriptional regulator
MSAQPGPAAAERTNLSREDWIAIARATLIREGVAQVKIDRLARALGVTRGGFYWRFKSREELLDALLEHWVTTNTGPFIAAVSGPGTPSERYRSLMRLWIDEREFSPDFDSAVRGWSRISPRVAEAVHEIDDRRIDALRQLFFDAGYAEDEAFIRARITYFHQVGYYAMGVKESTSRREALSDLYYRVLTGFEDGAGGGKASIQTCIDTPKGA